jgi:hypothetical protein
MFARLTFALLLFYCCKCEDAKSSDDVQDQEDSNGALVSVDTDTDNSDDSIEGKWTTDILTITCELK